MTQGFTQMRYEVVEDGETITLTDCDVSAATAFAKRIQKITGKISDDPFQTSIEFRDRVEKKFVKVSYEIGKLE